MTKTTTTTFQSRNLMPAAALLYAWRVGCVMAAGVSVSVGINRKNTNGGEVSG